MDAIAIAYVDVLRRIDTLGPQFVDADLARAGGKLPQNLKRDWPKLVDLGYVTIVGADLYDLDPKARRLLQAMDVNDGRLSLPDGFAALRHAEIAPHPLNPRKRFDDEALDELRGDIVQTGHLLQSLLVRPADPADDATPNGVRFWIVAGERRWRAIGAAIFEGDWPADRLLPAQVRAIDDKTHRRMALSENLQRADLDHIELAHTYRQMIDQDGETPQSLADDLNKTAEHVQQHLRLLRLPRESQELLTAGAISFHRALELERAMRAPVAKAPTLDELPIKAPAHPTPPPTAPDLTSVQALMLVEIADKVRRDEVAKFRELFTTISADALDDVTFQELVKLGAVESRHSRLAGHEARVTPLGPGAIWLRANAFNADHEHGALSPSGSDLINRCRAECVGEERARSMRYEQGFVIPWLNASAPKPSAPAQVEEPASTYRGVARVAATPEAEEAEPYQPALLTPTADEQERIDARAKAEIDHAIDEQAVSRFAEEMAEQFAHGRKNGLANWSDPAFPVATLADMAVQQVSLGGVVRAAVALAMLRHRAGSIGARNELLQAANRAEGDDEAAPCN